MKPCPNVIISFYDGGRDISFDCPEGLCKFALCQEMPPTPESRCAWNKYACTLPEARVAALEAVRRYCGGEIRKATMEAEAASCE
jgi:hypothetical protein